MSAILFTSAIVASTAIMQDADAYTSSGTYTRQTGSKTVCGEVLCSEYTGGRAAYDAGTSCWKYLDKKDESRDKVASSGSDKLQTELDRIMEKLENGERLSKSEVRRAQQAMQEQEASEVFDERYGGSAEAEATGTASAMQSEIVKSSSGQDAYEKTASDTITSVTDPGQGHESHQLAVLLPPSDKVYVGKMTFSASENVQFVALHGPLGVGEDKGQPIWSPDGETKYALTLVDNGQKSGGWFFAGNALALHSMKDTPFTASYSIA